MRTKSLFEFNDKTLKNYGYDSKLVNDEMFSSIAATLSELFDDVSYDIVSTVLEQKLGEANFDEE